MKNIITIIAAMVSMNSFAQTKISEADKQSIVQQVKKELLDSLSNNQTIKAEKGNNLTISGYIEPYYSYDFGNPNDHNRVGFNYSHQRHNEVNINLGYIKAAYQTDNVRANLAMAAGTYMNANYAAEPGVLKNLYEANVGVKISKNKNLWIDAGIMPSHIGFESAVGKDNWTVTRGIYAENSPYFVCVANR
jgi:hypothetical protein